MVILSVRPRLHHPQQTRRHLVQRLAAKPPTALAYVKESARGGSQLSLAAGLDLERNLFALLQDSAERREAAAAFREKRPPVFHGR